jgi:EAL domain-containing protein (putative c-di-GMP-specific phosphodiesterase class I)
MARLSKKLITPNGSSCRRWGISLLCALAIIPLASWLSAMLLLDDGRTYLLYLPLAACVALLMIFDWRALPGIALALFLRDFFDLEAKTSLILTLVYLLPLCLAWAGYRFHTRRRATASFGLLYHSFPRLIWLVIILPTLFIIILQMVVESGRLPDYLGLADKNVMTLRTLINYQGIMLGISLCGHLFYMLLRVACKPSYWRVLWQKFTRQRAVDIQVTEFILWASTLVLLVILLCTRSLHDDPADMLLGDYTLTLLLPVMLLGAKRYGYHFITLVWSIALIILFKHYQGFVDNSDLLNHLTFISALMFGFTLCLLLVSASASRERILMRKVSQLALLDPVVGLAYLRAFSRDVKLFPRSVLCFVRVAQMDVLSKNYGMRLRIQFKQQLVFALRPYLQPDEGIYHLPGHDLVLRLNPEGAQDKLEQLQQCIKNFRLIWNGLPVHPNIGLAWCLIYPPVVHLHSLLGELSGIAEVSLVTGELEHKKSEYSQMQADIETKVELLHLIQRALDEDRFVLLAQPINGVRGDTYQEIVPSLLGNDGRSIPDDLFLPVVQEFGLDYQLDIWVIKQALAYIDRQRAQLPSMRIALKISSSTLYRPSFCQEFKLLMTQHQVEPYQILLEMKESCLLQDISYVMKAFRNLRQFGCRIALDGFGKGYTTYDRLKQVEADVIKVDGSFVRHMLTDALDKCVITSICQVARVKRMAVVAEQVDSEEQQEALRQMGVDYMQGEWVGQRQPLSQLLVPETWVNP